MKVLIVDDHPANLKVLGALLGAEGHAIRAAANGIEALAHLERESVDVIVSDILMPGMDGYRFCYEVRRSERWRDLPFIFYTATYTSPSDEKLCYDLGADKYLRKPAPSEAILTALKEVVGGPRRRHQLLAGMDEGAVLKEYSERLVSKLEHKNIELTRNEQQLRLIVEYSPAAIAMLDREMRYLVVSRRWLSDYRLGDRDVMGRSHYEIFPEIPERWKEIHRRCLAGAIEKADEDSFPRADGTTDWVRWEVRPWHDALGDIGGLIMFTEVITRRKQTEAALHSSEEHFRILFEQAADGIFLFSQDLICRNANARCSEMFGYSHEELIGMNVTRFMTEPERVVPELTHVLAGRSYQKEWELLRKNGSTFLVETSAAALSDGLVLVTLRDITDRRRAEEALRESERRFNDMLQNLDLVSVMLDEKGRVMYCNDYLLRLTGWKRGEVLGKDWFELFIPPGDTAVRRVFSDVLADVPSAWHHENEILTRSGGRRLIHWNNTVLRSGNGKPIGTASIGEDITERRQAEEIQQRRADDLEKFHRLSVGRELQMIELKTEVNRLAVQAGQSPPYNVTVAADHE